jgi:hypothetical protein
MTTTSNDLIMWVVYEKVPPYPSNYQARAVAITTEGPQDTGQHAVGPLDLVRRYLGEHLGLTRLERSPEDDPSVVEIWL